MLLAALGVQALGGNDARLASRQATILQGVQVLDLAVRISRIRDYTITLDIATVCQVLAFDQVGRHHIDMRVVDLRRVAVHHQCGITLKESLQ